MSNFGSLSKKRGKLQGGHTLLPDFDRSVNTIATRGPIMLTTFLLPSAPLPQFSDLPTALYCISHKLLFVCGLLLGNLLNDQYILFQQSEEVITTLAVRSMKNTTRWRSAGFGT
jgi:hypothetical protein